MFNSYGRKKTIKEEYLELTILYLMYRNAYNFGFQRYSFFRNLIKYITKLDSQNSIRNLFSSLLEDEVFQKKIICNKIYYRFNPYKKEDVIPEKIIIHFD
tara:strand:- start:686 stop:985 length:300 start_codon:yes stop_codon:yes gene_type:complete